MWGPMLRRLIAFVILMLPLPAFAEWHEASTENFRVIADQSEKDVAKFAERLEKFHDALIWILDRDPSTPSPSNRVTIYVVRSDNEVQKLAGDKTGFLRGFYRPRAGGSLAFIARVQGAGNEISRSEQVLYHEYAHHVMQGASEWASPRWLSEGFAEFFSTARFEKNGGVGLGLPAYHRAGELAFARNVPIDILLDSQAYRREKSRRYDEFYGRSWLLYHYLQLSGNRRGQLNNYRLALAKGASEMEAAISAFGDLLQLDKELQIYLDARKMNYISVPAEKLNVGPITTRKLSSGEAAMMAIVLESKRGVNREAAKALLTKAKPIAAQFPQDPGVLSALAEAEQDAGNYDAAITAADRAISIDPKQINAYVQKILAASAKARDAEDSETAWKTVRRAATTLNKQEADHPIPLIYYYLSYQNAGTDIPELATQGLKRALELAPYDRNVRWQVVKQLIDDEEWATAYRILMPIANDPHNQSDDNPAIALMASVKAQLEALSKPTMQAAEAESKVKNTPAS